MPRQRFTKPWLHEASGFWCTSINRKRVYLDRDYKVACRQLRELRADQRRQEQTGPEWLEMPFADLVDEFLDDVKARKKPVTHQGYRYRLLRALRVIGTGLRVCDVKRLHLARIEQALRPSHSPTTVKDTIATVQTVFGWAVRHDLLSDNPLARHQKPQARMRTRTITPAEFVALMRNSDPPFRRVLITLRKTGCRPGEVRNLIWDWVDLENGYWILPDHKTITRQRQFKPRIIPLPAPIWKLCHWLARESHQPADHVFVSQHGHPYSKDCLCRKMARARKRAKIEVKAGERLVLYSARHTFATEASGKVSDIELAELMGQTDIRTTRRYIHLNASRLRDIQRRAQS